MRLLLLLAIHVWLKFLLLETHANVPCRLNFSDIQPDEKRQFSPDGFLRNFECFSNLLQEMDAMHIRFKTLAVHIFQFLHICFVSFVNYCLVIYHAHPGMVNDHVAIGIS